MEFKDLRKAVNDVSNGSLNLDVDKASETDVSLVRLIWVDAAGIHRCRGFPAKRFNKVVTKSGAGLTYTCMAFPSYIDSPAEGCNLVCAGEIRLMPDLSTKTKIPWMERQEMVLSDMHVTPGEPWEYCPRGTLRRLSKILKDEFDLIMNAGFENEFLILKSVSRDGKEEWVPFESTAYCSTAGFDAASPLFQDMVDALDFLDIPFEQVHKEAGKGQLEIALEYSACLNSADNVIYSREVIRSVARKHGYIATFVPKYALDDLGTGSHVHLSLERNGENVFMGTEASSSQHGISKIGREFMAGVLHHIPSILAFIAPVPNSYDRIQPNMWSGAYQCWGEENKEAALRTARPPGVPDGLVSNFEIKSFDGCANPYLGLAAILAAGIDGLRRRLELPEPVGMNPALLEGKIQRLPGSLSESVEALENDSVLDELIGSKLCVAIKAVRKAEIEYYSKNKEAFKEMIFRY